MLNLWIAHDTFWSSRALDRSSQWRASVRLRLYSSYQITEHRRRNRWMAGYAFRQRSIWMFFEIKKILGQKWSGIFLLNLRFEHDIFLIEKTRWRAECRGLWTGQRYWRRRIYHRVWSSRVSDRSSQWPVPMRLRLYCYHRIEQHRRRNRWMAGWACRHRSIWLFSEIKRSSVKIDRGSFFQFSEVLSEIQWLRRMVQE